MAGLLENRASMAERVVRPCTKHHQQGRSTCQQPETDFRFLQLVGLKVDKLSSAIGHIQRADRHRDFFLFNPFDDFAKAAGRLERHGARSSTPSSSQ